MSLENAQTAQTLDALARVSNLTEDVLVPAAAQDPLVMHVVGLVQEGKILADVAEDLKTSVETHLVDSYGARPELTDTIFGEATKIYKQQLGGSEDLHPYVFSVDTWKLRGGHGY